jgi:hypothetical protein
VFRSFNNNTRSSFTSISGLKQAWEDPKTAQLLAQCAQTTNQSSKHVDLVAQHDIGIWGWTEREAQLSRKEVAEVKEVKVRNSEKDEEGASELWGNEFESFEWKDNHTRLSVTVKRPGVWLNFEVKRRNTADGVSYEVQCVGNLKEYEVISRCLFRREGQQDIFDTLETLLAYGKGDLSRADCDKCGKYRDETGSMPCARRKKYHKEKDDKIAESAWTWVALHEGCL